MDEPVVVARGMPLTQVNPYRDGAGDLDLVLGALQGRRLTLAGQTTT
jgi:hypothetical protein